MTIADSIPLLFAIFFAPVSIGCKHEFFYFEQIHSALNATEQRRNFYLIHGVRIDSLLAIDLLPAPCPTAAMTVRRFFWQTRKIGSRVAWLAICQPTDRASARYIAGRETGMVFCVLQSLVSAFECPTDPCVSLFSIKERMMTNVQANSLCLPLWQPSSITPRAKPDGFG